MLGVAIDQNALEPPSEYMSYAPMTPVRGRGVDPIQTPHPLRKFPLQGLGHEKVVIRHRIVGVAGPVVMPGTFPERSPKKKLPILIDRLPPVSTRGAVVRSAGEVDTLRSSDAPSLGRLLF